MNQFLSNLKIYGTIDEGFPWKLKRFSKESIINLASSGNSFAPKFTPIQKEKIGIKFQASCLKEDKISFNHRNVVNFLIYDFYIPGHVI